MSRNKYYFLFLAFLLAMACKEKYISPVASPVTGYLVVEGFINSGTGPTTFTLSRSGKLGDTASIRKEARAIVRVESKNGYTAVLPETFLGSGVYSNPQLNIVPGEQYRLSITTYGATGKAYYSDYSDVRRTVDIDSVSWIRKSDGVQLYANTHDPSNNTRYYRYSFDETWEIHSRYQTYLKFYYDRNNNIYGVGYRDSVNFRIDSSMWRCWKNYSNTDILITNSEKLNEDRISMFPLEFIDKNSWKIGVLYSVQVKQYAMSRNGYRYFEQMRKNTQQLGSIFDAQPSDNIGNIKCVNDPTEPVLGFIEVSEEKVKRIFIQNVQVNPWVYDQGCPDQYTVLNVLDSIKRYSYYIPTNYDPNPALPPRNRVLFTDPECADCRIYGVSTKPNFWP